MLGGGGYVAGPMVLAAWTRRIPAALTEADSHLGLANRLAAPFARRVFLCLPDRRAASAEVPRHRPAGAVALAGDVAGGGPAARSSFRPKGPVLLVFGGSQGARSLNELVVGEFGADGPAVLHLAGERDYEALRGRVSRPDYRLFPYTHDFGAALGAVDLVLCRAGGSVFELALAGKPAVLVPYPHATADHQAKNARYFEQAGAALVVADSELERVPGLVRELLCRPRAARGDVRADAAVARPDAADEIAEELIALAGRSSRAGGSGSSGSAATG